MIRVLAAVLAVGLVAGAARAASPVVLELFTSESCSSCPPADALLGRLRDAGGADLLPLSLHVDYWNRIGWVDRYSSAAMTERQYEYARWLGGDGVYTPELVVDGARGVVGSDAAAVQAAIDQARAGRAAGPAIPLAVARDGARVTIDVGAGDGPGRLVLVGFDDRHVTAVRGGENDGRTLTEYNVVRSLAVVGSWSGAPDRVRATLAAGEHAAVLLQDGSGRILAAAVAG